MNRKTAKTQTEPENVTGSNRKVVPPIQRSGSPGQVPAVHQSATLHQVTLPGTRSQMIQQLSEPASWDSGLVSDVKCDGTTTTVSKTMKIQVTQTKSGLTPQGEYAATLKSIVANTSTKKSKDGQYRPINITATFELADGAAKVAKEYPPKVEVGCMLLQDIETVLGRRLTPEEEREGVDDSVVTDKPCRVVVVHHEGSTGKVKATVGTVKAPESVPAR